MISRADKTDSVGDNETGHVMDMAGTVLSQTYDWDESLQAGQAEVACLLFMQKLQACTQDDVPTRVSTVAPQVEVLNPGVHILYSIHRSHCKHQPGERLRGRHKQSCPYTPDGKVCMLLHNCEYWIQQRNTISLEGQSQRAGARTLLRSTMSPLARTLQEAWSLKGIILGLQFGRHAKAELAAEVLIIWRHCQRQAHVLPEKFLGRHFTAVEAHRSAACLLKISAPTRRSMLCLRQLDGPPWRNSGSLLSLLCCGARFMAEHFVHKRE